MRTFLRTVLFIALPALAVTAAAEPGSFGEGPGALPGRGPALQGSRRAPVAGGGERWAARAFARLHRLDLSDEQRSKLRKLESELRRKNWDRLGKIMDERDKLRDLYAADKRDPKTIGAVYGVIFGHRRQMIEAGVETLNRAEALLSDAQRQQLRQLRRGPRPGGGPGAMSPA
jgi:Spy/CpxP family protein refolding chaperone